MLAQASTLRHP